MYDNNNYPNAQAMVALSPTQETLRQRLERKRKFISEALVDVTTALELLDGNPSLEKFHDAVTRAGY